MGLDIFHIVACQKTDHTDSSNYLTTEERSMAPFFFHEFDSLLVDIDDETTGQDKVLYYKQIGYQRKGMKKSFYKNFENDKIHFDFASVQKAYHYLEAGSKQALTELQENYQQNFIRNFV